MFFIKTFYLQILLKLSNTCESLNDLLEKILFEHFLKSEEFDEAKSLRF